MQIFSGPTEMKFSYLSLFWKSILRQGLNRCICYVLVCWNIIKNDLFYFAQMKGEMVGDQEFEISESYGKVFTPRWLQQLYIDFWKSTLLSLKVSLRYNLLPQLTHLESDDNHVKNLRSWCPQLEILCIGLLHALWELQGKMSSNKVSNLFTYNGNNLVLSTTTKNK